MENSSASTVLKLQGDISKL